MTAKMQSLTTSFSIHMYNNNFSTWGVIVPRGTLFEKL